VVTGWSSGIAFRRDGGVVYRDSSPSAAASGLPHGDDRSSQPVDISVSSPWFSVDWFCISFIYLDSRLTIVTQCIESIALYRFREPKGGFQPPGLSPHKFRWEENPYRGA